VFLTEAKIDKLQKQISQKRKIAMDGYLSQRQNRKITQDSEDEPNQLPSLTQRPNYRQDSVNSKKSAS